MIDEKNAPGKTSNMMQCDFPISAKSQIMQLNQGDKVIIGGKVKFMTTNAASPSLFDCVLLNK